MQYGPSIQPKTFLNTSPQFFTKQGFANYLARALQSVGMLPLNMLNKYDLADPANAERDPGGHEDAYFWWDYPTSETFSINGVPYRPCLGLSHNIYRSYYGNNNPVIQGKTFGYPCGSNICFMPYRRRADRLSRGDMISANTQARGYPSNYGFGGYAQAASGYFGENGGSGTGWTNWKLFASWTDANMQQLLFVNRVFVHLSPAGLVVQVGTHPTRRDETCNILNFLVAFHGGRIPNRALAPIDDVLRDSVNPAAWFDLGAYADGLFANSTRPEMATALLGAEKTVNGVKIGVDYPVYSYLRSIDYFDEAPVGYAPTDNYPRPSPTVRNGDGVHLLHRACLFTLNQINGAFYVGRIDTAKQPSGQPLTAWSDVFYLPNLALCDRVVPPGPRVDPVTTKTWYLIWATPRQQAFAIDYTGVTTVATPTSGAESFTLEETIPIDVTALAESTPPIFTSSNRSLPLSALIGHPRTLLGVFSGVTIYVSQMEIVSVPAAAANLWKKPAATNGFSITNMGMTASESDIRSDLWLELEGLSTDPRDFYWLEYDYRGRVQNSPSGDPATNDYFYLRNYMGPGDVFVGDPALAYAQHLRVGATVSYQNFYYNFVAPNVYGARGQRYPPGTPYTPYDTDRFQPNAAGRAMISLAAKKDYGNSNIVYSPSFDIRNLVLKRYRRA